MPFLHVLTSHTRVIPFTPTVQHAEAAKIQIHPTIAHTSTTPMMKKVIMAGQMTPFRKDTSRHSVYYAGPWATGQITAQQQNPTAQIAQSFVSGKTTNLCLSTTRPFELCSTYEDPAPNSLPPIMASTFAPCAMTAIMPCVIAPGIDLPSIIHRSITPYKPEGWRQGLLSTGLTHSFPHLVHNISSGSPIGNPPPLTYTFIPHNLKSADIDPVYMDNFIKELIAGCFNGPFSVEELHIIFGGHFCMAPL